MRHVAWVFVAGAVAAAGAAIVASSPASRADPFSQDPPVLANVGGSLVRTWLDIGFPVMAPPYVRVTLVESAAPVGRGRPVPVRLTRESRSLKARNRSVSGHTTRALAAGHVYDVVVRWGGGECAVLRAAFTAHAPRATLVSKSGARGESVKVNVEFAARHAKFWIGGIPARIVGLGGTDGEFEIEVPHDLPRGITDARVTVATAGQRATAAERLQVLPEGRVFAAVVGGVPVSSTSQSYFTVDHVLGSYRAGPPRPWVYVLGSRSRALRGPPGLDTAVEGFRVRIPVDLATATLPVTLTGADGVEVRWSADSSLRRDGRQVRFRPGPQGYFSGREDVTVTVDSFDGSRITGTFSGHLTEIHWDENPVPDGREIDITRGRFEVDPQ